MSGLALVAGAAGASSPSTRVRPYRSQPGHDKNTNPGNPPNPTCRQPLPRASPTPEHIGVAPARQTKLDFEWVPALQPLRQPPFGRPHRLFDFPPPESSALVMFALLWATPIAVLTIKFPLATPRGAVSGAG